MCPASVTLMDGIVLFCKSISLLSILPFLNPVFPPLTLSLPLPLSVSFQLYISAISQLQEPVYNHKAVIIDKRE